MRHFEEAMKKIRLLSLLKSENMQRRHQNNLEDPISE